MLKITMGISAVDENGTGQQSFCVQVDQDGRIDPHNLSKIFELVCADIFASALDDYYSHKDEA